jgi:hypothetical protein
MPLWFDQVRAVHLCVDHSRRRDETRIKVEQRMPNRNEFHIEAFEFTQFRISHFDEGIIMRAMVLCILTLAALLPGCSPTGSDISSQPTPNSRIYIEGGAYLNSPSATGKAPYTVYCTLMYADTGKNSSDFNSADVKVNGASLVRVYSNGYFQNTRMVMSFSEGDSLEFVIRHQKIGTVRGVVHVPPSVDGVSVSPGLSTANLPNSETTFNLNWVQVTASYYYVQAAGYNYWQTLLVADSSFSTLANSATVVLKDSLGSACPYVYFRVLTFSAVDFQGFAPGSGLSVSGAYFRGSSNMPNVDANVRQPINGRDGKY